MRGGAAELVLAQRPWRIRRYYLCDVGGDQVAGLEALKARQPPKERRDSKREIEVLQGDFNDLVHKILKERRLDVATFRLLDQRTFECKWATVEALARHRTTGNKIELFYFLPIFWLNRAFWDSSARRRCDQAEAQAFSRCVGEWLRRNPVRSASGRCALCKQSKGMLLPYLTGYSVSDPGHTWLHQECSKAWHQGHRATAVSALVAMGITIPVKFADDFGKNGGA